MMEKGHFWPKINIQVKILQKRDFLHFFQNPLKFRVKSWTPSKKIYPKYVLKRSLANFGKTQKKSAHSMRSLKSCSENKIPGGLVGLIL